MYISQLESSNLKSQVIREILRYIRSMDLEKDNKLPREETLCQLIGTSRVTLRAALDELASNGAIFRRHGRGTFVNVRSLDIKVSINPAMDIYKMISLSGFEPKVKLLENGWITVSGELEEQLEPMGLRAGQSVYFIQKIFYANESFCAYIEDYLNPGCIDDPSQLERLPYDCPLFPMLQEELKVTISWDHVELGVAEACGIPVLKKLIAQGGCPSGPLLLLSGMNYDNQDKPILFGKEYIDTRIIKFNQIRKRTYD